MTQTTFYSRKYQGWPPVANRDINNGNSYHWETQAQLAQRRLNDLLGDDDYRLWAELTWPGDSIDAQSWKQIHDTCQFAIVHIDQIWQTLECECSPVGLTACPVCRAQAKIREREEQRI